MRDDDELTYSVEGGIATITFNRPDRLNAWTERMTDLYSDALDAADNDQAVRVVVTTGAGRGYCAGADLSRLDNFSGPDRMPIDQSVRFFKAMLVRKPVVAAINGACAGIGLVQALTCDVRFAAGSAKLTCSFARRGLVAEEGISWLLPRIIGAGRALDLLLSARVIQGDEVQSLGLANRVVEDDVLGVALDYAAEIAAACSPSALAVIKRQVYRSFHMSIEESLAEARRHMAPAFDRDLAEGVASYRDKRAPRFAPLTDAVDDLPLRVVAEDSM